MWCSGAIFDATASEAEHTLTACFYVINNYTSPIVYWFCGTKHLSECVCDRNFRAVPKIKTYVVIFGLNISY